MNINLPDINPEKIPLDILSKMEFIKFKWICKAKGCNHFTHLKDYGTFPKLLMGKRKWVNIFNSYFLCSIHYKIRDKVKLKYSYVLVDDENKKIE